MCDEYYSTAETLSSPIPKIVTEKISNLIARYANYFKSVENGLIFGTVAVRNGNGFVTTSRGKHELDSFVNVIDVDHSNRKVHTEAGKKASLNAPLLDRIFMNTVVDYIVHYHEELPGLNTYDYAPPGTVRDTDRNTNISFNIKGHGCMLIFNQEGRIL